MIQSKEIVNTTISKIVPNPKNANKHSKEQIERLAKIIDYQGFRDPLIVSKRSGFLVVGHGRLEAAQLLGMEELPVMYQDFESEAQEYAHMIADNEIARWAEFDITKFKDDFSDYDLDVDLFGIEDFEIPKDDQEGNIDDDEVPETNDNEMGVELGDLWELGNHRLLCGDSTKKENVERLMNGEKADMVFTDPPYGMNLDTDYSGMPRGENTFKKVIGDDKDFDASFIFEIECDRYAIWGADWFYNSLKKGFSPIVWDKQPFHVIAGPQNHFELCWVYPKEKRRTIRKLWTGFTAKEKNEKRVHPTQKPIDICVDLFKEENLIVDLFLGSGSTLIACEKTNRKCFGMELDPHYCSVIIKRWEEFTGLKARKV